MCKETRARAAVRPVNLDPIIPCSDVRTLGTTATDQSSSQIAELAVPDEILTDSALCEAVGSFEHTLTYEAAGRRSSKAFDEPLMLYSVTRASNRANAAQRITTAPGVP
jgi:hypothetical protein